MTYAQIMKDIVLELNHKVRENSDDDRDFLRIEFLENCKVRIMTKMMRRSQIPVSEVISHKEAVKALRLIKLGVESVTR